MKAWSLFEETIMNTNLFYQRQGVGVVTKIPNGTKTIRQYGKPIVINTSKTGCDFIGHLEGKPIAFDCKSTENKTMFPLMVHQQENVKQHQKMFLSDFKRTGGFAFLLIQFNKSHQVFLVDIDQYLRLEQKAKQENKSGIAIKKLEGLEVVEKGYFLDYAKRIIE